MEFFIFPKFPFDEYFPEGDDGEDDGLDLASDFKRFVVKKIAEEAA